MKPISLGCSLVTRNRRQFCIWEHLSVLYCSLYCTFSRRSWTEAYSLVSSPTCILGGVEKCHRFTMGQNRKQKHTMNSHLILHCPTSGGCNLKVIERDSIRNPLVVKFSKNEEVWHHSQLSKWKLAPRISQNCVFWKMVKVIQRTNLHI